MDPNTPAPRAKQGRDRERLMLSFPKVRQIHARLRVLTRDLALSNMSQTIERAISLLEMVALLSRQGQEIIARPVGQPTGEQETRIFILL